MMNLPLVSVIIPSYNRAYVIERALKSVLAQSYDNFEIIVVDDGSTDETESLIRNSYPEIKYYFQKNQGVSAARNLGIRKANGQYICFLDSDDLWLAQKLESQVNYLSVNPQYRWLHTEEIWIRNGKRVNQMKKHQKAGGDQFIPSLPFCLISPSTIMMESSLLREVGGFSIEHTVCEDYDLWLRTLYQNEIGFIDQPYIEKYGGHEDQLSTKFFAMDYWRIKTLVKLLRLEELTVKRRDEIIQIGIKKCEILIRGYEKHKNLQNIDEVRCWLETFKKASC